MQCSGPGVATRRHHHFKPTLAHGSTVDLVLPFSCMITGESEIPYITQHMAYRHIEIHVCHYQSTALDAHQDNLDRISHFELGDCLTFRRNYRPSRWD